MAALDLKRKKELQKLTAGLLAAGGGFQVLAMLASRHLAEHPETNDRGLVAGPLSIWAV